MMRLSKKGKIQSSKVLSIGISNFTHDSIFPRYDAMLYLCLSVHNLELVRNESLLVTRQRGQLGPLHL